MAGACRGVDRQVGVARHALSMVDTEGVLAKGGMGILVIEGLGLWLVPSTLSVLGWITEGCFWFRGVQVSGGWW